MSRPQGDHDSKVLHSMGYAQELSRRLRGFSNFAISFSIICILSGGINSLGQGISGVGGAAIGIGWLVGAGISLVFALAMAQIASAYPTAGGLYHWGSILGGRGFGWATAWLNLLGLVSVLGAINVGTYYFFMGAFGLGLGLEANLNTQVVFLLLITGAQALVNHLGIGLTSRLTDFSGYLILAVAAALTVALLVYAPSYDFSRLWTFTNCSGEAGGGVWPQNPEVWALFLLGLLLPIYTITGFDASAHTAEETLSAQRTVPSGIVGSVVWSGLLGWIMLCAFVLAIPNMDQAAAQGFNVFFHTMQQVVPSPMREGFYAAIFLAQLLCGLATVTSASRMVFAFARDNGFPAGWSATLRKVHVVYRVPVAAIWISAAISFLLTLYAPVYTTIVSVTVIFLFLSYCAPLLAGLWAYGRTWRQMGPWSLGLAFRPVALLGVLATGLIFALGIQPPNDRALPFTVGLVLLLGLVWWLWERHRFQGPPVGQRIAERQAEIAKTEAALERAKPPHP